MVFLSYTGTDSANKTTKCSNAPARNDPGYRSLYCLANSYNDLPRTVVMPDMFARAHTDGTRLSMNRFTKQMNSLLMTSSLGCLKLYTRRSGGRGHGVSVISLLASALILDLPYISQQRPGAVGPTSSRGEHLHLTGTLLRPVCHHCFMSM
jgi:hypothetical protein